MSDSRLDLLRWQFDLTWALGEVHLVELTPDDLRWEPAALCWTMRRGGDGAWVADWAETEPDPIPVPTMAWLSWHIGWWWGTVADHLLGRSVRERESVRWPGPDGAVAWLTAQRDEWLTVLDALTEDRLDEPSSFPWPEEAGFTVGHQVAWVNAELMKNLAEVGQQRLARAALRAG